MAEQLYPYAVARIHAREAGLLSGAQLEQLLAAPDYPAVLATLAEKGWDTEQPEPGAMLAARLDQAWALIGEMVDSMAPFDVFLYLNDYHNLKAAIKRVTTGDDTEPVFVGRGTLPPELLQKAAETHDFSLLPARMREPAEEAWTTMKQTGDGQLCDLLLDRAALVAVYAAGKETKNALLCRYAELTVAAADIKTAVRCQKTGKSLALIRRALAPCDSLNTDLLARAAAESREAIYSYLQLTDYASAVDALKTSTAAFERWCDNLLIASIRPEKTATFGIGPLAAYLLAVENEVKSVRMILSGKLNELPAEAVRERMRDAYV